MFDQKPLTDGRDYLVSLNGKLYCGPRAYIEAGIELWCHENIAAGNRIEQVEREQCIRGMLGRLDQAEVI